MTDLTVTIPHQAAMGLVAHALGALDGWPEPEDEFGCCPQCCAPCGALLALLGAGQLDDIARPYSTTGGLAWWDYTADRVDRGWLARGWREAGCEDSHDDGLPRTAEEWSAYLATPPVRRTPGE